MADARASSGPRPYSPWPKTGVRIAFDTVWLVDDALKWTTHYRADYIDHLKEGSDERLAWLDGWFRCWVVLVGFARKLSYTAALIFSLLIWATAEGFGGPYTGASADVDPGIISLLAFTSLLAFACYPGTSRLSVD